MGTTLEPLEPGTKCKARVKNGLEYRDCEILASRVQHDTQEYYVHYLNFNKRLDEWILADRVDHASATAPPPAESGGGD